MEDLCVYHGLYCYPNVGSRCLSHLGVTKGVFSHSSRVQLFVIPWTAGTRPLCPWGFSMEEYCSGLPCPPRGDLPNPGIEPTSSALQADSRPTEPPGKPKNTAVGSLSLLQGIFPAQESNRGLLHCRWILYQLSRQGSPTLRADPWIYLGLHSKSKGWICMSILVTTT